MIKTKNLLLSILGYNYFTCLIGKKSYLGLVLYITNVMKFFFERSYLRESLTEEGCVTL